MERQKQAYLYTIFVVLIWSTVASAFKISLRYLSFNHLLLFASFCSVLIFFIILLFQSKLKFLIAYSTKDYLKSALLGLLNPFIYYLVLFKAYSLLPAQEAQPLNQTWAIVLSLLSIVLLKQRIGLKRLMAIFISFIGVCLISTHGDIRGFKLSNPLGVSLALGSALIWALFWIYNIKDQRDEVMKLFWNFSFGFIYILIFNLVFSKITSPSLQGLVGALYVGTFEMGITFVLWLKALKLSKTTVQVSNIIYLVPFLSLIVINFAVGEKILPSTIIGLAFIVAGIIIQQKGSNGVRSWNRDIKITERPSKNIKIKNSLFSISTS